MSSKMNKYNSLRIQSTQPFIIIIIIIIIIIFLRYVLVVPFDHHQVEGTSTYMYISCVDLVATD